MTPFTTTMSCLLALVAGQAPQASRDRDDVHKMVIVNGARRSVHYYPSSPGDADSYRDLERTENEDSIAGDLQHLRALYIRDEQYLEPIRTQIQKRLYGSNHTESTTQSSTASTFYPVNNASSFQPLATGGGFQNLPTSGTGASPKSGVPAGTGTSNGSTPNGGTNSGVPGGTSMLTPGMGLGTFGGTPAGTVATSPGGFNGFNSGGSFFNPFGFGGNGFGLGNGLGLGGAGLLGAGSFPLNGVGGEFSGPFGGSPLINFYGNTATAKGEQTSTTNYSLANGMGDEGRLKTAISAAIASQSTVEYQHRVQANLQAARAAIPNRQPHVAVTLKDGEKRNGRLVQQSGEWLVIRDGDEEHYVRTADIVRMTKSTTAGTTTARAHR